MALVSTAATILKTYEYSETSKILRLLTPDVGLCSVIAKGARRTKSRFGGLLEPFTDGVATFYTKDGRDLHTLSEFELRRERQALGRELVRYAGAGLVTELALRCAPAAPDPQLFRQLRHGLDRLVDEPGDVERAILEETWELIRCLGFAPSVEECTACSADMPSGEAVAFDVAGGGVYCERCRAKLSRHTFRSLSAVAYRELAAVAGGGLANGRLCTGGVQRAVLRDFIAYHLSGHRPLNSFRFLEDRFV